VFIVSVIVQSNCHIL